MSQYQEIAKRCAAKVQDAKLSGREVVQLPVWDNDQRGAPAAVLRSALFGVIKRGSRRAVEKEILASWPGVEIRYTGFRLDQADLDCWLQVLHLARLYPLGQEVRFTARGFLRSIGRNGGGKDHAWLDGSLNRMVACAVAVRSAGGQEYTGSLISDFFVDRESGRFVVRVNPLLADIFDSAYVKLTLETRLALPQGLPRFLQAYVQSHKATPAHPHRIRLDALKTLCGSQVAQLKHFRAEVRRAMEELQRAGVVASWCITKGDALEFVRPGPTQTAAQCSSHSRFRAS
jgi:hypothetical protein